MLPVGPRTVHHALQSLNCSGGTGTDKRIYLALAIDRTAKYHKYIPNTTAPQSMTQTTPLVITPLARHRDPRSLSLSRTRTHTFL